jgi:hypothetical protein
LFVGRLHGYSFTQHPPIHAHYQTHFRARLLEVARGQAKLALNNPTKPILNRQTAGWA